MSVIITVAEIRPPAPGKKQAAIIDSTGKRWGIAPSTMGYYSQNGTYEVTKFKENYFNGNTYYTIESAVSVGADPSPPLRAPSNAAGAPNDDKRRMDIFVCGAFNNVMSNPNCSHPNVESMVALIEALKTAWKRTLGPQAQETLARGSIDKDMNDDIPF